MSLRVRLETCRVVSFRADLLKRECRLVLSVGLEEATDPIRRSLAILSVDESPVTVTLEELQLRLPGLGVKDTGFEKTEPKTPKSASPEPGSTVGPFTFIWEPAAEGELGSMSRVIPATEEEASEEIERAVSGPPAILGPPTGEEAPVPEELLGFPAKAAEEEPQGETAIPITEDGSPWPHYELEPIWPPKPRRETSAEEEEGEP